MSWTGDTKPAIPVPLFNSLPGAACKGGDLPHRIAGEATANLETQADPGAATGCKPIKSYGLSRRTRPTRIATGGGVRRQDGTGRAAARDCGNR